MFGMIDIFHTFALTISRGGAVVARQAHNLEVIGSNPVSATRKKSNLK